MNRARVPIGHREHVPEESVVGIWQALNITGEYLLDLRYKLQTMYR